jgi:hypothetical protein
MEDLQQLLTGMSKPEVPHLKHQEALTDLIIRSKRKITLSLWWLSVPVFVIAVLLMEQAYKPGSTLWSSIRKLKDRHSTQSALLLFLLPLVVCAIQLLQLRKYHLIRQSPWRVRTNAIWVHLLLIFLSLITILIYLCN